MIWLLLALVVGGGGVRLTGCGAYEVGLGNGRPVRIWTEATRTVVPEALPEELEGWWEGYAPRVSGQDLEENGVLERELRRELLENVPPSAFVTIRRWGFERWDGARALLTTVVLPTGATITSLRDLEAGSVLAVGIRFEDENTARLIEAALAAPDEDARAKAMARLQNRASRGEIICQVGPERRYLPAGEEADVAGTLGALGRQLAPDQWRNLRWWLAFLTQLSDSSCVRPGGTLPRVKLNFDPAQVPEGPSLPALSGCTESLSRPPALQDRCEQFRRERYRWLPKAPRLHTRFEAMFGEVVP